MYWAMTLRISWRYAFSLRYGYNDYGNKIRAAISAAFLEQFHLFYEALSLSEVRTISARSSLQDFVLVFRMIFAK
jgi:hypothetical protein